MSTLVTIPTARPVFVDSETRNGVVDSAALTKKLADWINHAWAHDVRFTPEAPVRPYTGSVYGSGGRRIRIPPSLTWSDRLVITTFVEANGYSDLLYVRATNIATGESVDDSALATSAARTSVLELPFTGEGEIHVAVCKVGFGPLALGDSVMNGLSVRWKGCDGLRSDVTLDSAWSAISQSAPSGAPGRPDSAYLLRWLARKANLFANWRPRMIAASFPNGANQGGGSTYANARARVTVLEAPLVPSIRVWVLAYQPSAVLNAYVTAYRDGVTAGTITIPGGIGWSWRSLDVSVANSVPTAHEWAFQGATLAHVSMWENPLTAGILGLPGGETVPASFEAVQRDLIAARQAIRADRDAGGNAVGRAALVRAMIWTWANRMPRCLLWWNREIGKFTEALTTDPIAGDWTIKMRGRYVLSPGGTNEDARYFVQRLRAYADSDPSLTLDAMKSSITSIGRTAEVTFPVAVTPYTNLSMTAGPESEEKDGGGIVASVDAASGYFDVDVKRASSDEGANSRTTVGSFTIAERPRNVVGTLF